jgi:D-glycero-D-manno-heptose 1,7-bisphosphate phosphatase
MKRPAAFIDRDGTLIEEVNFLSRVEDLRLFDFTGSAVGLLRSLGYYVIVVTNQSGIGRGIYDEKAMHQIHDAIQVHLENAIDAFYFCPHMPDDGCACRKPGLGMIEAALADFEIDLERSWLIGDKKLDVETAKNAGIRSAMVMTGYGREHLSHLVDQPDILSDDLGAAVQRIADLTPAKVVV